MKRKEFLQSYGDVKFQLLLKTQEDKNKKMKIFLE